MSKPNYARPWYWPFGWYRHGTYFHWHGLQWRGFRFSINEGELPNIHVNWHGKGLFIYIALTSHLKWYRQFGEYVY